MSSNTTDTSTADDDSGIGGWAIWLIIFFTTAVFFYSIVLCVCYHEYKKYRFRKPKIFNPNGNYPKQVMLTVPPARQDQPTGGNYPKQEYTVLNTPGANPQPPPSNDNNETQKQSATENKDSSAIITETSETSGGVSENDKQTTNSTVSSEQKTDRENKHETDVENHISNSETEQLISLPSPKKKKSELPPLEEEATKNPPDQRILTVGFVDKPLPSIQDGSTDSMTPVVGVHM